MRLFGSIPTQRGYFAFKPSCWRKYKSRSIFDGRLKAVEFNLTACIERALLGQHEILANGQQSNGSSATNPVYPSCPSRHRECRVHIFGLRRQNNQDVVF